MKINQTASSISFFILLRGMANAGKPSYDEKRHLRKSVPGCKRDLDCSRIRCKRSPCPQLVCHEGLCVADSSFCGGKVCKLGEICCAEVCGIQENHVCPESLVDELPRCIDKYDCPQARCSVGYPCPSYDCYDGNCIDVSNGELFAPCRTDDECVRDGDKCFEGKCVESSFETPPMKPLCKQDFECPQPPCLPDAYCPEYVCKGGVCVDMWSDPLKPDECETKHPCPQPGCMPGHFCPSVLCVEGKCITEDELTACTKDAKQCPDGSYVSRVGPACEFAPCPSMINCTDRLDCPIFKCRYGAGCPDYECDMNLGICVDRNTEEEGEICGSSVCGQGQYCCNRSCSVCAPKPDGVCTQQVCGFSLDLETQVDDEDEKGDFYSDSNEMELPRCCEEPKPADLECGRSGCHCCGDGVWLLGNSGPTLSSRAACGKLGSSIPCFPDTDTYVQCYVDDDCPVINCVTEPCPFATCENGKCSLTEH